jgi:spermidine synthase
MPFPGGRLPTKSTKDSVSPNHAAADAVPVVSDDGGILTLHFGSDFIQSQMVVDKPDSLALAYTRTMMSFELFLPEPREIALIGLGGGSIAKWCCRHHAQARITAVEINPHVIAVGEAFGIPPVSEKFRILCEDGAKFMAKPPQCFDLLLIDCCTTDRLPLELCSQKFYNHCKEALIDGGLMVMNLCWRKHTRVIARIQKSFAGQVLMSRDVDGNTVVFACKGKLLWPENEDEVSFQSKLKRFERKHGLGKAIRPRA